MSAARSSPAADRFITAVDRLVGRVAHWQAGRWAAGQRAEPGTETPHGSPGLVASRADRVYGLVQRLADRSADAEGQPHRPVPRLGDLVLPDQTRVMANDLLLAGAEDQELERAADDVDAVRRTL